MRVVPALDEVEDSQPRFDLVLEAAAIEQFAFESGEEALRTSRYRTRRRPTPSRAAR